MKQPVDPHGFGGPRHRTKQQWVVAAQAAIINLLDQQLAAPRVEIDRRLHEVGMTVRPGERPTYFDPHIISEAVNHLAALGGIALVKHETKGGRNTPLYTTTRTERRNTDLTKAIRRKAMLYARFERLSATAGEAGELVVRESLKQAGDHLRPMTPGYGEVRNIGPARMNGSLDSGAWLHSLDSTTGLPNLQAGVPIEVKNRRLVLYPTHKEIHQILYKAAVLQTTHPHYDFVPTLICRRVHRRSFWMARDLGFLIHPTECEYVYLTKSITDRLLNEVRSGLALTDLVAVDPKAPPRIINFLTQVLPGRAAKQAARWKITAPLVLATAEQLRRESAAVTPEFRADALRALRQTAVAELEAAGHACGGGWSLPDRADRPEPEDEEYDEIDYDDYEDPDEWI
jgi:hypothetical protein